MGKDISLLSLSFVFYLYAKAIIASGLAVPN